MKKSEAEAFANFEVYIHGEGGKTETICLCDTHQIASAIAKLIAKSTKEPNIKVYVSGVYYIGAFIPGGGWYDVYWHDEKGELKSGGVA